MSDAPRYGKEVVAGQPAVVKSAKPATGPMSLKDATKKAALIALEKKKAKKKPQGETTVAESE